MLPVRELVRPSVLAGQTNGELPASLLTAIPMPAGGTAVVLEQCAPKWLALLEDAAAAGFAFGQNGDYRPYAEQRAIFLDRYQTTPIAGRPTKSWQGQVWYQKPGTAVAATPGFSNHGWGLALDLCLPGGESLTQAAVDWLCANAADYGISAEIQSEDWHWRPYDGDAKTTAVLAYEQGEDMFLIRLDSGAIHLVTGAIAASGKLAAWHLTKDTYPPHQVLGLKQVNIPKGVDVSGLYDLDPQPFPAGTGGGPLEVTLTGTASPITAFRTTQ